MTKDTPVITKGNSWKMFNDISPKYDFLNHFLSFGIDKRWRRQLAQSLPDRTNLSVLDLATGTADVPLSFIQNNPNVISVVGLDLAENMLAIGRRKINPLFLADRIELRKGDANAIPFSNGQFDAVSIAFGIRNMENPLQVLREMHRVLKKDGRALVLEFSLPQNVLLKFMHLTYLRYGVPLIGGTFSGHYKAYKYLNKTIETFPYGEQFCLLMRDAGFEETKARPLLGGIATIYSGEK